MGDFFKKNGPSMFNKAKQGVKGGGKKSAEMAKSFAKKMANEYSKKMVKKALTSKLAMLAGAFLGKIIIIVAIVAILLFPLAYAMIIYEGALDSFNDATLKASVNLKNTWGAFFDWSDNSDKLDDVAKNYENFLIKRFTFLNNKILTEKLTPGDGNEAKNIAVGWVYGKVYSDYFKKPNWAEEGLAYLFGDLNELTKTYILKSVSDTAKEVYTPVRGSNVEDSRREVFGDSINLYDIEAFDYLAGTLYDLMELDLDAARKGIIADRQKEIDEKTETVKLNEARNQANNILKDWRTKFGKIVSDNKGSQKHLADLELSTDNLLVYSKDSTIHSLHTFMKDNYSYSSGEEYKWFINELDKLDEDGCENGNSTEKITEAIIKESSDIKKLESVASEIEKVYVEFMKSFGKTTEDQLYLKVMTQNYLDDAPLVSIYAKYYKKYINNTDDVYIDVVKTVTDDELKEQMTKIIKELNLTRTQQAALTYRNYLTETEQITTIKYYSFNMKNPLLDRLYTIPKYTMDFFTDKANSKEDIETLVSSDKYYKGTDPKFEKLIQIQNLPNIKENVPMDSKGNPIVVGIDTTTGIDYLASTKSVFASGLYSTIDESIKELEDIKLMFDAAKNPNSKEYKEIVSKLEATAWEEINIAYSELKKNSFSQLRIVATPKVQEYFGDAVYEERLEFVRDFESDLANHTKNSKYWAGFRDALVAANNGLPDTYSPLVIPYVDGNPNEIYDSGNVFATFVCDFLQETPDKVNDYIPVFESYNALITKLSNSINYVNLLNGEPSTGDSLDLNTFFDRATQLISKEIEKLNKYKEELKTLETATYTDGTDDLLIKSSVETVYLNDTKMDRDKDYIINDNEIKVMKFKNTQEEAVKKTASDCFGDVLAKIKGENSGYNSGIVIDIGDLKIGENTVPGAKDYDAYNNALNYLPLVQEIISENYDLIDPYYIIAMIAAESSGLDKPYTGSEANAGIMQIGSKNFYRDFKLPNGDKVTSDPYKLGTDHKLCIQVGLSIALDSASHFAGNLLMGITGYNMGDGAMYRIIFLTLVGQGKADINDWKIPGSDWQQGIYKAEVRKMMIDYMKSGDLDWLNYREAYQDENWYNTGTGTANHLERVLSFYNVSQGMPWYRNSKDEPKIVMGEAGGADISMGKDENGNKIYHKDKRLYLWKEYYTQNDTFKSADIWFRNNAVFVTEKPLLLSTTIIKQIEDIKTKYANEISLIGLSAQELQSIVAATLNVGTVTLPKNIEDEAIVGESGFRIKPVKLDSVRTMIGAVTEDYIELYKDLGGKDKDFALYLYYSPNRELAKIEVMNHEGSFKDFVKNKYKEDQESFTSSNSTFTKVAQTITGDLKVDVKSFFGLLDSLPEYSEDSVVTNPVDIYFEEWLKAKYLMHDVYNTSIEQTNAERVKDGYKPYPLLPTYQEAVLNKKKPNATNDIEGTLTVKGPDGIIYSVQIKKKFLTNQGTSPNKPTYIVIHDTGDVGTDGEAPKRFAIMNSDSATETMHYVVGSSDIYHMTDNYIAANHINDSATSTGGTMPQVTNTNSLGIQFEASITRNKDKVFWHTVAITKYLMEQNDITNYDNIILHNDVTGANDSKIMLANDKEEWIKFKDALKNSTVTFTANSDGFSGTVLNLISTARSLLGQPYVYGAVGQVVTDDLIAGLEATFGAEGEYYKTPRKYFNGTYVGYDCSSFVQYVYAQNGINIPRTTYAQMEQGDDVFKAGEDIVESKLQPGDLLFSAKHVVMWIGGGEYIHASEPGDVIKIGKGIPSNTIKVKRFVKNNSSFEFYSQHDPRWASHYYCGDNVSKSGCGPTSTAMILSGLKHNNSTKIDKNKDGILTPDELCDFSNDNGTFLIKDGTTTQFYYDVGTELNIPVKIIWAGPESNSGNIIKELKAYLSEGKAIVASYKQGHWMPNANGHLVAFVGVDNNNQIIVHDPNLNSYEDVRGARFNGPNPDANIAGPGTGAYFFVIFG